jgi:glycosyltransferase involved in cell wall biosynthesis
VRSFLRALAKIGVEVALIDFPEWADMPLPPDKADNRWSGSKVPVSSPAVVQFCMPYQVTRYRDRCNVNFTMFELARVPWFWLEHSLLHDHVVVPEACSRQAWLADGFPAERISICHLGIDCARFRPEVPAYPLGEAGSRAAAEHRVRFLNVSAIQPRKNLLGLLRVWLEATRADDDAVLIVKLSYSGPAAAKFMRDLHFLEREIGRTREQAASLLLIHWWEPDREAAIEAIRKAIDGRDVPRGSARERMKRFSWENAARRLCDVAEEVVARSGAAA